MEKNITIDDLAIMVQKGFNDMTEKMVTKIEMEKGFKEVNKRLEKIENIVSSDYKKRIEKLESDFKELKQALAL